MPLDLYKFHHSLFIPDCSRYVANFDEPTVVGDTSQRVGHIYGTLTTSRRQSSMKKYQVALRLLHNLEMANGAVNS